MRLRRRTEQIIEGTPAEITALHQAQVDGFHPEPPTAPPPGQQTAPNAQPLRLYECRNINCGSRLATYSRLGEFCPICHQMTLGYTGNELEHGHSMNNEQDFARWSKEQRDKEARHLLGYGHGLCGKCRRNSLT